MRALVAGLCAADCAGRAAGSAGGRRARRLVLDALRAAGLDPHEQPVPACGGANVLATIPGDIDRYILVAAHFDHLGIIDGRMYPGADDNAAAVGILVELAARLAATRAEGRGIVLASFDAEEPPHFMTPAMGSMYFLQHPLVPVDRIDLMVCLDLVGHALGSAALPAAVRNTVFLLGAETSAGTPEQVDELSATEEGVIIRRLDAGIIPPMSDYAGFWQRDRPFVFLTGGRARTYHTPLDTPDRLDWSKIEATSRWLERFVRRQCARDEGPFRTQPAPDDLSTLDSAAALVRALYPDPSSARALTQALRSLRDACRADRSLPTGRQAELAMLVGQLERSLA